MMETLASLFGHPDQLTGDTPTEKTIKPPENQRGFDRLVKAFTIDEFGEASEEASTIIQMALMSMFAGGIYGGVLTSKIAYTEFFQYNQATAFKNHLDAKKKLQDKVTIAFGKGAAKFGIRLTFFTTTYMGISTAISVYRDKNGIMEHLVAGASTGLLYKFKMGPAGWLVGAGLGLVLGLVGGGTQLALLTVSGMTMTEVRQRTNTMLYKRSEALNVKVKERLNKEDTELLHERIKLKDPNIPVQLEGVK